MNHPSVELASFDFTADDLFAEYKGAIRMEDKYRCNSTADSHNKDNVCNQVEL